jgi:peptidylprolyl isomerase
MLPEIITAVRLLQVGEISPPTQSRLGFHLLRLTESLPARALSYEEARPEIMLELENQQRTSAMAQLIAALR